MFGWRDSQEAISFIEMEYLTGQGLNEYLIPHENGLSWQQSQPLLEQIIAGLDYAHQNQLLHRDLKPENIFIDAQAKITLLDFGLGYQLRQTHSALSQAEQEKQAGKGTCQYMAPESFLGHRPGIEQDIYSLSCVVYQMLTGQKPYSEEKAKERKPSEYPEAPDILNTACWELLKQGMAYDKTQRPKQLRAYYQQLLQAQSHKAKPVVIADKPEAEVQSESGRPIATKQQKHAPKSQVIDELTDMELLYIPPGGFMMGSPEDEEDRTECEYLPDTGSI